MPKVPRENSAALICLLVLATLFEGGQAGCAELPGLTKGALEIAKGLRATRMGVDRAGNLWAWNDRSGSVQVVSPSAALVASSFVESHAVGLDYDPEWGIVWLDRRADTLHVNLPGDEDGRVYELGVNMSDVAWIGPQTVAVAPVRAAHRVEIWDLVEGRRVATWGKEEPIPERLGAVRTNTFRLNFEHRRQLLYSFETFTGSIVVFDTGKVVLKAQAEIPGLQAQRAWLAEVDRKHREADESQDYVLDLWGNFGIDHAGAIRSVKSCRRLAGAGRVLETIRVDLEEYQSTEAKEVSCCALNTVIWGNWILHYRESGSPGATCTLLEALDDERR